MESLVPMVDWVETHNARLVGHGNEDAQAFALEHGLPGISVSDAHSVMEVGVAYTAFDGNPVDPGRPARDAAERGDHPGSCELPRPAVDTGRQGHQSGTRQRPGSARRRRPMSPGAPTDGQPIKSDIQTGRTIVRWPTKRTLR